MQVSLILALDNNVMNHIVVLVYWASLGNNENDFRYQNGESILLSWPTKKQW